VQLDQLLVRARPSPVPGYSGCWNLHLVERAEDLGLEFLGDADAAVLDGDPHDLRLTTARRPTFPVGGVNLMAFDRRL